jgi:phosphoenolpyruvate carboxylase
MAYIVDLTVILNGLFISSHSVSATEVQSAMKYYHQNGAWSQVHTEIRSFVAEMPFTYHERDTIMEKIIDLITQNCIPTSFPTSTQVRQY